MPLPADNIETRQFLVAECEFELRAVDGQKMPGLVGYPALYGSLSRDLGGFREIIRGGAFAGALQRAEDVVATINHDRSKVLGRFPNPGTCRLSQNVKGLRMEIDELPDTSYARDMVESIRRGDVRGMSFAFRTIEDAWREEIIDNQRCVVRELVDMDLHDVSVVTDPAYPETSVGLRSLQTFQAKSLEVPAKTGMELLGMRLRLTEAAG